ncbi:hypothetical protein FHX52_4553 [Humibacillus xanthopallidus]|uniref:Uncharacterized protein n=1 Tax=Humibacillus xanthopallidus TaxID=412689 RepID=A0A543PML3_9MICO|nr:DUF6153 family protein [Humibacillus xanthopallidus]TQN45314.1 hypothetical protein FHX52_4553 [Humibacillus xanthopallidus]
MTPSGHQRRRSQARLSRWLLVLVTLVLALGVVVMHSLGIGHHGSSHLSPGGASSVTAGAAHAHEQTGHHVAAAEPSAPSPGGESSQAARHGASVMCLAVLPLLLLLRRGGRAWFARAVAAARRPVVAVPGSWLTIRARPPGSILSELCILRT